MFKPIVHPTHVPYGDTFAKLPGSDCLECPVCDSTNVELVVADVDPECGQVYWDLECHDCAEERRRKEDEEDA